MKILETEDETEQRVYFILTAKQYRNPRRSVFASDTNSRITHHLFDLDLHQVQIEPSDQGAFSVTSASIASVV